MEELLTPHEAAAILRVPVSFVYERTRHNAIPLRRVGKYVRIPREELMAWVDAQSTSCAGVSSDGFHRAPPTHDSDGLSG